MLKDTSSFAVKSPKCLQIPVAVSSTDLDLLRDGLGDAVINGSAE
jgi:hypothetical protein